VKVEVLLRRIPAAHMNSRYSYDCGGVRPTRVSGVGLASQVETNILELMT
jgi:hypothetical protein